MAEFAASKKMTSDEFLEWAMMQPKRYELEGGEVVAMAPERLSHTETQGLIYRRLAEALEAAGLSCRAYTEGVSVEIDSDTV